MKELVLLRRIHSCILTILCRHQLLDMMFDEFADMWMKMKIQVRTKEELDSQQYKFKPRAFDLKMSLKWTLQPLKSSNEAFS